jgi:hypothetical protein
MVETLNDLASLADIVMPRFGEGAVLTGKGTSVFRAVDEPDAHNQRAPHAFNRFSERTCVLVNCPQPCE